MKRNVSTDKPRFFEFNYTPVLSLFDTDFVDYRVNYKDFIPFGDDNALPRQLIKLARGSSGTQGYSQFQI